jgi:hypothetical protein
VKHELDASGLFLGERGDGELAVGEEAIPPIATLRPHRVRGSSVAVLLLGKSSVPVLVNGFTPLPVTLLDDGCELIIGRHLLRFCKSQPQSITRFSKADRADCCATCTRPLEVGDEILRCSSCQAPRHEGELAAPGEQPLRCATYDVRCSRCGACQDDEFGTEAERLTAGDETTPPPTTPQEGNPSA